MSKLGGSYRLLKEFVAFSREHKVYWIVPLAIALAITGFVLLATQTAAPLIYTLF